MQVLKRYDIISLEEISASGYVPDDKIKKDVLLNPDSLGITIQLFVLAAVALH